MIAFKVDDMRSSRSAGVIIKSVKALDHRATVRVDLTSHRVEIEPTWTEAGELSEAIQRAGFTPTLAGLARVPLDAMEIEIGVLPTIDFELPEILPDAQRVST